ncbi:metalloregulator ArsR/SmtB family transcription factor [Reichenbachiella sp. MALMAid0571]|uniref:ArsR/SmtB family transcription factor n=1 Tax=Reichenbachiella sp. MALMAid0571 TaxID=3143939 RepID=UPI0032DEA424
MSNKLNNIFKAIADPTRREIFNVLIVATTALSITQISEHFDITRQGVTKHIKLLKAAGLIETNHKGREHYCSANPEPLKEIRDWITFYEKFWENKLNKLGDFLDKKSQSNA